jgi:hypothetical protein
MLVPDPYHRVARVALLYHLGVVPVYHHAQLQGNPALVADLLPQLVYQPDVEFEIPVLVKRTLKGLAQDQKLLVDHPGVERGQNFVAGGGQLKVRGQGQLLLGEQFAGPILDYLQLVVHRVEHPYQRLE